MRAASSGYEFQRLHGMGEVLYELLLAEHAARRRAGLCAGRRPSRSARLSGAAAAGERRQLVVRGGGGRSVGAGRDRCCKRPQSWIGDAAHARHPKIPLPRDLYAPARRNFAGRRVRRPGEPRGAASPRSAAPRCRRVAAPLVDGIALAGIERAVTSPIDGAPIGRVREGDDAIAAAAMAAAASGLCGLERDAGREPRRGARARRRSASRRTAAG